MSMGKNAGVCTHFIESERWKKMEKRERKVGGR
jgi:hypothetical protein